MVNQLKSWRRLAEGLSLLMLAAMPLEASDSTYVRFNTSLGNIDVQMLSDEAPKNVANFMNYVNGTTVNGVAATYNNSIIHRSIPNFIIQGGALNVVNNTLSSVSANPPTVMGEPGVSNVRGTLSMALLSPAVETTPASQDTGSDSWFFNLVDNTSLDTVSYTQDANIPTQTDAGGPFTVFGRVTNTSSLAVMDALGAVQTFDFSGSLGLPNLPLLNYTSAQYSASISPTFADLVYVNSITVLAATDYSAWSAALLT